MSDVDFFVRLFLVIFCVWHYCVFVSVEVARLLLGCSMFCFACVCFNGCCLL